MNTFDFHEAEDFSDKRLTSQFFNPPGGVTRWKKCNFSRSQILYCECKEGSFRNCNFTGSNLSGAAFVDVFVRDSSFESANMEYAQICFSSMVKNDFTGTRLSYSSFLGTDLTGSIFDGANMEGVSFAEATIKKCSWRGVDMSLAVLSYVDDGKHIGARYEKYKLADLSKEFRIPREDLLNEVKAGNLELRDNTTYLLVDAKNYNPKLHHVPVWSKQNFGDRLRWV